MRGRAVAQGAATRLLWAALPAILLVAAGCAGVRPPERLQGLEGAGAGFAGVPAGFPPLPIPADNPITPEKIELGRRLFYDPRLSGDGELSCATCHRPELAFTDGRARAIGARGEGHRRGTMSLVNVAYNASYTWADPGVRSLEQQMLRPMFQTDPVELGMSGRVPRILQRFAADPAARAAFRRAFPGERHTVTLSQVIRAIATYERTLLSGDSPYDRLVFWGEAKALSESARRGMELFFSPRLACGECHGGFNLSGPVVAAGVPPAGPEFHNTGLYDVDGRGGYPAVDRGMFEITGRPEDDGRFRAPTLRNVALTAPYMHDGSIATLPEVIAHYAAGGRASAGADGNGTLRSPLVSGFELSEEEVQSVLAFLDSLTDRAFLARQHRP